MHAALSRRSHFTLLLFIVLASAALAISRSDLAHAATLTVNITTDPAPDGSCDPAPGDCSLREAIIESNFTGAVDTIDFNIPGALSQVVIAPDSELPAITSSVTITGICATCEGATLNTADTWQPSDHDLKIILSGQLAGANADGLTITGGTVIIRGLVINSWSGSGIYVAAGTSHVISGNLIGTSRSGTAAAPNARGIQLDGGTNVLIGGTSPGMRNLISGNDDEGIRACAPGPDGLTVHGNFIGVRASGTQALPNGTGIFVCQLDNAFIGDDVAGAGNLISGNDGQGIAAANTLAPFIQGNRIGTNGAGTADVPNGGRGMFLMQADAALIGGATLAAGNLVSGNAESGIEVNTSSDVTIRNNITGVSAQLDAAIPNLADGIRLFSVTNATVAGNVASGNGSYGIGIGGGSGIVLTDNLAGFAMGPAQLGNEFGGIYLSLSPTNIDIGGPGGGNEIAFNGTDGVYIFGTASNVDIKSNLIHDNSDDGVAITGGATGIRIGSTLAADANTVFDNGGDGVKVSHASARARILGNRIYDNGDGGSDLPIDIASNGVEANDPADADAGANNIQNHPTVIHAFTNGTEAFARVRLESTPNSQFTIELFVGDTCTTNRNRAFTFAGRRISGITGPDGVFEEDIPLNAAFTAGEFISATATDQGPEVTSELSPACVAIEPAVFIDTPGVPASFQDDDITIDPGTQVAFVNRHNTLHTVTSDLQLPLPATGPYFDSGNLDDGDVFRFTFNVPGEYTYFCDIHPAMTGIVRVSGSNAFPSISSADPGSMFMEGGDTDVTITGAAFTELTAVEFFDGVTSLGPIEVLSRSASTLEVRIPASYTMLPGEFDIAVTNPAPGGGSERVGFHVVRWPTDVQCDLDLDALDILAILRKLAGFEDGVLPQDCAIDPISPNADVNRDGEETLADALFARARIAGLVEDIE